MNLSPHFTTSEFRCKCGACEIPQSAIENLIRLAVMLEKLRADGGDTPVVIVSGYRCAAHNKKVGGAKKSRHLTGEAADIVQGRRAITVLARVADRLGFGGIGVYAGHLHVDIRPRPEGHPPVRWVSAKA